MQRLRTRLPECPHCTGTAVGRHVELYVPENQRKIWSPWLSVSAEPDSAGSRLRGRFGPHPHIWTWYLFCAFAIGFGLLVGSTWSYAQWALDQTPWALLAIPIGFTAGMTLWLVSKLGQRLGHDQMSHLRYALEQLTIATGEDSDKIV